MRKIICLLLFVNAVINETNAQNPPKGISYDGQYSKAEKAKSATYQQFKDFYFRNQPISDIDPSAYCWGIDDEFMKANMETPVKRGREKLSEGLNYIQNTYETLWVDQETKQPLGIEPNDVEAMETILDEGLKAGRFFIEDADVTKDYEFYSLETAVNSSGKRYFTGNTKLVLPRKGLPNEKLLGYKAKSGEKVYLFSLLCLNPFKLPTLKQRGPNDGRGDEDFQEEGDKPKRLLVADGTPINIYNIAYGGNVEKSGNTNSFNEGTTSTKKSDVPREAGDVVPDVTSPGSNSDDRPAPGGGSGTTNNDSGNSFNLNISHNAPLFTWGGGGGYRQPVYQQPVYNRPTYCQGSVVINPPHGNQGQGHDYGGVPGTGGQGGQDYDGVD